MWDICEEQWRLRKNASFAECDGSGGSIGHGGMTEALSLDSGRICRRDFRGRFSKVKVLYFYGGVCAGLRA